MNDILFITSNNTNNFKFFTKDKITFFQNANYKITDMIYFYNSFYIRVIIERKPITETHKTLMVFIYKVNKCIC